MGNDIFSCRNLLDIILKTNKKNAGILADRYLLKDISVISRWKNNKVIPKEDDIAKIVDFAICESTEVQRRAIRAGIELLVCNSSLREDIKEAILNAGDFGEFLTGAFNVCTSPHRCSSPFAVSDNETDSVEGYSSKDNTVTELSQNPSGRYTGTMRFELDLSKNEGNKQNGSSGKQGLGVGSGVGYTGENKLRKYILRGRTVLSVLAFGLISSIVIFQLTNSGQNSNPAIKAATVLKEAPAATSTPLPVQTLAPEPTPVPPAKKEERQSSPKKKNTGNAERENRPAAKNEEANINANININHSSNLDIAVGNGIIISGNDSGSARTPQPVQTPDAGVKEPGN